MHGCRSGREHPCTAYKQAQWSWIKQSTWSIPNHKSEQCDRKSSIIVLLCWLLSAYTHFTFYWMKFKTRLDFNVMLKTFNVCKWIPFYFLWRLMQFIHIQPPVFLSLSVLQPDVHKLASLQVVKIFFLWASGWYYNFAAWLNEKNSALYYISFLT